MSTASDRSTPRRYIRAARVVTASARGVIEDGAVAVEGSRITAVGPAVERATKVKLERRTLIVETTSLQWSREVTRSTPTILKRLQTLLGADVVERIEVRRA